MYNITYYMGDKKIVCENLSAKYLVRFIKKLEPRGIKYSVTRSKNNANR